MAPQKETVERERICKCGHHTNDHSYNPESLDTYLECDKCGCKDFSQKKSNANKIDNGGEK